MTICAQKGRLTDVRVVVAQRVDDGLHCALVAAGLVLEVVHEHERAPLVPPAAPRAAPSPLREECVKHPQLRVVVLEDAERVRALAYDAREDVSCAHKVR